MHCHVHHAHIALQLWLRSRAKPAMAGAGGATIDVSAPPSSSPRVVDVEAEEVKPSGRDLDARGKKKKAAAAAEVMLVNDVLLRVHGVGTGGVSTGWQPPRRKV